MLAPSPRKQPRCVSDTTNIFQNYIRLVGCLVFKPCRLVCCPYGPVPFTGTLPNWGSVRAAEHPAAINNKASMSDSYIERSHLFAGHQVVTAFEANSARNALPGV
jgi:hypothetical protein